MAADKRDDAIMSDQTIAGTGALAVPAHHDRVRQIVFIDSAVPDASAIAQAAAPDVRAVMLKSGEDGVAQIAAYLSRHHIRNLAAIDIVAHGEDGTLQLGDGLLDAATIPVHAADLATIGAALAPGGDIQIYGCDVAQDAAGYAFLQQLSQATGGANIAASSELVGSAALGGSWTLNVDVGTIDVSSPFTPAVSAYPDLLALTNNQIFFAAWNGEIGSTGNRVEQFGVTGSTLVSGSTADLADTSQSNDSGLISTSSGIAVDTAQNKYFVAVDQQTTGTLTTIQEGNITGAAGLTTFFTDPLPNFDSGAPTVAALGGLALDAQTGELYFAQDAENYNTGAIIAADTGIYKISLSGGGPTLVTSTTAGLTNPVDLVLDTPANLLFFTDALLAADGFPGASNLDEVNLTTGSVTVLHTFFSSSDSVDLVEGLDINAAAGTLYVTTVRNGANTTAVSSSANAILSIPFTVAGTGGSAHASIGSISTLYSGAGADQPQDIVIDPNQGIFYTVGEQFVSIDTDYASVFEGSLNGGTALTEVVSMANLVGTSAATDTNSSQLVLDQPPTITASGTVTWSSGGGAVTADAAASVSDPSSQDIAGVTVAITGGTFTSDGDTLTATTAGTNVTASYTAATETLTLTGVDTPAHYQQVLDSVAFNSTAAHPANNGADPTRTLSWTVTDGVISSATETSTVKVMCFAAGTRLATPHGERPVETLRSGDGVIATDLRGVRRVETVRWVGIRRLDLAGHPDPELAAPVRIRAGALAPGLPARDVVLSPDHCVLVDGHLLRAWRLINGTNVAQELRREVTYLHVELDRHALLLAEGMAAESYLDEGWRGFFGGTLSSPGPLRERAPMQACAPFAPDDAFAERVWRRIAAGTGIETPLPQDAAPTLRLLAGDRALRPIVAANRHLFVLPRGRGDVRLVSTARRPTDRRPWAEDRRRLGVSVRRITVDSGRELPLDGPGFGAGWHAPEPGPTRWTNGDAQLRLPRGARVLELRLAG